MPLMVAPETMRQYSSTTSTIGTKRPYTSDNGPIDNAPSWRIQNQGLPPSALGLRDSSNGRHQHINGAGAAIPLASPKEKSDIPAKPFEKLLRNPIQFVPASDLTTFDEMAVLRSHKLLTNENDLHRIRRGRIERLPRSTWPATGQRAVGFYNPSNFCYRTSVLQTLMHIPRFDSWLQQNQCHVPARPRTCLFCAVFALAWGVKNSAHDIRQRVIDFNRMARHIGQTQATGWEWPNSNFQDDAFDVVQLLFGQFLRCFDDASRKTVESLFYMSTISQFACPYCHELSDPNIVEAPGLPGIKLGIDESKKRPNGLEYYLKRYFNDILDDIYCEKCHERGVRQRRVKIRAAPEALFIQLSRFGYGTRGSKILKKVPYPHYLPLGQYVSHESPGASDLTYKLASVVAHRGTIADGHYQTFARRADGSYWRYDDETPFKSSLKEMLNPSKQWTPYILMYLYCKVALMD